MNTSLISSRRVVSALLLSIVLAGCASGPNTPPPDLLQRIETARTPGDHEALATYYDKEAAEARAKAAVHRKMATSYQGMYAGGRGTVSVLSHCNAIVATQESLAVEYEGMAVGHRQMAKQARP